jgi:hypothetical protein
MVYDPEPCLECIEAKASSSLERDLLFIDEYVTVSLQQSDKGRTSRRGTRSNLFFPLLFIVTEPTEYKIGPISHTDSLHHFKLLIYQYTDVPPAKLQISQDGKTLKDSQYPLSHFNVRASKPFHATEVSLSDNGDGIEIIEDFAASRPERGGGFSKSRLVAAVSKKKEVGTDENAPSPTPTQIIDLDLNSHPPNGNWACEVCTFVNPGSLPSCEICLTKRGGVEETGATTKRDRTDEESSDRPAKKQKVVKA